VHTYIYVYIYTHYLVQENYSYIQTLAQNRTAVTKISCLATRGNNGAI